MHDDESIAALVERVIAASRIPSRATRDDLRHELWTHFEDACASPDAARDAIRRFGGETLVAESFRAVYRWEYLCLYSAKIAASIVACIGTALLIQAIAHLNVVMTAQVWPVPEGFARGARVSVALVLGLI